MAAENHLVVYCQICGDPLPQAKVLPTDFFVICQECVKETVHHA